MINEQPLLYDEPPNKAALALAAAVHAALLAALFFGMQWKNEQPGGMPVDVYYGNPAAALPPPRPIAEPEPEPAPERKAPPKIEPKEAPKAVEKPQIDPQIAIKDKERREREEKLKREKEREEQEKAEKLKKQKLEEEQKRKEEIRKEEEEKKKREQKEKDKEEKRKSDLAKQLERDLNHSQQQRTNAARAEREAALRAELEGAHGSLSGSPTGSSTGSKGSAGNADSRGKNAYIESIRNKIRGNMVLPPGIQGNPEAIFDVVQLPSGELISVKLSKSTSNKQLDEAIERAIRKSEPLPQPQKAEWFDRTLKLKYKPFVE